MNGTNGSSSSDTMLTNISAPTLQACSSGGRIVRQGLDNGDGGGTAENGVLEGGEVDYTTTYCSYFIVKRMTDISPGGGLNGNSLPNGFVVIGTRIFFEATHTDSGAELWAYETINGSTWLVADINPGSASGYAYDMVSIGTRLYFGATDGSGHELWAHETNNDSTWEAAGLQLGYFNMQEIKAMGTRLYFDAFGGTCRELWVHETTNDSTWQVIDIWSGNGFCMDTSPEFTAMDTQLYFKADDGFYGKELYMMEIEHTITYN